MRLAYNSEGITTHPAVDEFRDYLGATVIDDDNFKMWRIRLLRQRSQTLVQRPPIVVNSYDDAEEQGAICVVFTHIYMIAAWPELTAV
jgi:hypothetical protein